MNSKKQPTRQCCFGEVAEIATEGTKAEDLVAMGRNPIIVETESEYEAAAAFVNQLNPSGSRWTCVLGKVDSSLQQYIICEPTGCDEEGD